ncbi:MAG: hypothetical protein CVU61_08855 [Deltaproteobacteria bacterium HGW-Deltaproteobacteria-19]|jgi:3-hydroxymyristoyl/3-hydroxydecanoyl-(acyl carrier protein) dehydratase|nr:MAG: hypothetical protein CVU61_08855 [Deltaproteobacteria bacterium HGW-Deltaproteobacteria-19]
MTEYWQDLKLEGKETSGRLVAKALFAPKSLWFSGHFPGYPIVPGVALLYLVAEVLRRGEAEGDRMTVESIRRVRFRQPVRPGDSLTVLVSTEEGGRDGAYLFRLLSGEETVCTGSVLARLDRSVDAR